VCAPLEGAWDKVLTDFRARADFQARSEAVRGDKAYSARAHRARDITAVRWRTDLRPPQELAGRATRSLHQPAARPTWAMRDVVAISDPPRRDEIHGDPPADVLHGPRNSPSQYWKTP